MVEQSVGFGEGNASSDDIGMGKVEPVFPGRTEIGQVVEHLMTRIQDFIDDIVGNDVTIDRRWIGYENRSIPRQSAQ